MDAEDLKSAGGVRDANVDFTIKAAEATESLGVSMDISCTVLITNPKTNKET